MTFFSCLFGRTFALLALQFSEFINALNKFIDPAARASESRVFRHFPRHYSKLIFRWRVMRFSTHSKGLIGVWWKCQRAFVRRVIPLFHIWDALKPSSCKNACHPVSHLQKSSSINQALSFKTFRSITIRYQWSDPFLHKWFHFL